MNRHNDVPGRDPEQPEATAALEGAVLELIFLKAALRRKRWLWISTAVLGLILAVAMNVHRPVKFSAMTAIDMAPSAKAEPDVAIAGDVGLLDSPTVAGQAVRRDHLAITSEALLSDFKGTAVGESVLQITTTASSYRLAAQYANVLASAFLSLPVQNLQAGYLETKMGDDGKAMLALERQVDALSSQIYDSTPAGGSANNSKPSLEIQRLTTTRNGDNQEISSLQTDYDQAQSEYLVMTQGNRLIERAVPAPVKSRKKVTITDSLAGLIAGAGLGVGIVVVGSVLTDRLRRRDEIAIAIGARVELSIGRYRRIRFLRHRRLARRMRRPSREIEMIERRIRAHLDSAPGTALAIIPLECCEPAVLAAGSLALSLRHAGQRIVVADLAERRPLHSLLGRAGPSRSEPDMPAGRRSERRHRPHSQRRRMAPSQQRRMNRLEYVDHPQHLLPTYGRFSTPVRSVIPPNAIPAPPGPSAGWDARADRYPQRTRSIPVTNPHTIRAAWNSWNIPSSQNNADPPTTGASGEAAQSETVATPATEHINVPVPTMAGWVTVVAGPDDPAQTGIHSMEGADATLVLATIDPAFGADHIASWASEAVVMVAAGKVTATRVVAARQMLHDAGITIRATLVLGADRDDETYGQALDTLS